LALRYRGTGKIAVVRDIGNPGRLAAAPNASRQSDAGGESGPAAEIVEFNEPHYGRLPDFHAAQEVGAAIHAPDGAVFPSECGADGLQDFGDGLGQRGGLGKHKRSGVLRRYTALETRRTFHS